MGKIITYEYVRKFFSDNNCELLENEYKKSHSKLKYRCKCGNFSETTWNNFKKGHRCFACYGKKRITYEYVRKFFSDNNCELLENEYKNDKTPMKYKCCCGNESKTYWTNFERGNRCRKCMSEKSKREKSCRWNPDRERVKLNDKIRKKYYQAISSTLRKIKSSKTTKSEELLGFTTTDLMSRIESFENWKELKDTKWSLDHIFPIKAFLDFEIYDPKIINCLDNLQPISLSENCSKRDKYDEGNFKLWLATKGIQVSK